MKLSRLLDARSAALPQCGALIRSELEGSGAKRDRRVRAVDFDFVAADAGSSDEEGTDEDGDETDDHVENRPPPPVDPAAAVASRSARMFVYAVLCLGVQMFMSYDGGALPASLNIIQKEMNGTWSQFEFGLLGSMDKIGMVITSMPWGLALQWCTAKWLMVLSLFFNAVASFAFGDSRNKLAMYGIRFVMGATQSLQAVWGTVWTVKMAPPDTKTLWLGLGAVSAGLGNGIGTAVAGFGTANGLPYSFAFQAAAVVLGIFWIIQIFVPSRWLSIHALDHQLPNTLEEDSGDWDSDTRVDNDESTCVQLRELMYNKVYFWTAMAISMIMYQVSAIQFLWNQAFVNIWNLDQSWVTLMFLLVTGGGSGVGIAFGPQYIDRRGGYGTYPGIIRSLTSLWMFALVAAIAGACGFVCVFEKGKEPEEIWGEWGDHYLYMVWAAIFVVNAAQNASVAALCGINMAAVPEAARTFASGTELTIRNVLGFTMGPLLPGIVMTQLSTLFHWDDADPHQYSLQLICGLAFVLAGNLLSPSLISKAKHAATLVLRDQQEQALRRVREAYAAQKLDELDEAVLQARRVELEKTEKGEAVLMAANQAIGQLRQIETQDKAELSQIVLLASRAEMQRRAQDLEAKVRSQELEIEQLRSLLRTASATQWLSPVARTNSAVVRYSTTT